MTTENKAQANSDPVLRELDTLLAAQGKLQFAREDYNEEAATVFGVALLDFMRVHGMEVRRRIATALTSPQADKARGEVFDFAAHLARQRQWSETTFGPGARTAGVIDHIRKELWEVEAAPEDGEEWVDVVILALDGAWRSGLSPEQIIAGIVAKQTKNEGRMWPDWRTADPTKAIEHERTGDWKAGDLVRYDAGETALAELVTPHAGGWHARQCMGGITFISEDWRRKFYPLTPDDRATWERCAKHRRPTTATQPQGDASPNPDDEASIDKAWQRFQAAVATPQVSGGGEWWPDVRLHEVECDLPSLFGRASREGHEAGQRLAAEIQAKMRAALSTPQARPSCPDCGVGVLFECVACSATNYPKEQARPSCDCGSSEGNREPHHDECALLANEQARPGRGWPPCPECGAGVLFECVACSATNYPTPQVSGGGEVEAALMVVNDAANKARHSGDYQRANALVRVRVTLARAALSTPQARPDGGDVVAWPPRAMKGDIGVKLQGGYELLPLTDEEGGVWNRCLDECQRAVAHPAPAPDVMRLVEALRKIEAWDLPETGETWPSGGKVSYEAAHGSNGARDYVRNVAREALAAAQQEARDTAITDAFDARQEATS